jgi:hypothetical protein
MDALEIHHILERDSNVIHNMRLGHVQLRFCPSELKLSEGNQKLIFHVTELGIELYRTELWLITSSLDAASL